jgi:hypothetical protein
VDSIRDVWQTKRQTNKQVEKWRIFGQYYFSKNKIKPLIWFYLDSSKFFNTNFVIKLSYTSNWVKNPSNWGTPIPKKNPISQVIENCIWHPYVSCPNQGLRTLWFLWSFLIILYSNPSPSNSGRLSLLLDDHVT